MRPRTVVVAPLVLLAMGSPAVARAEFAQSLKKTVVTLEVPVAVPISEPLRDRFGLGAMPSVSAAAPLGRWMLLGLRLRMGFLSNGPAPSDPSIKDPGAGGLGVLSVVARFRPLGKPDEAGHVAGPWIEVGAGPGITGGLVRATGEAALGWNFLLGKWALGPTVRYLHVIQPSSALDSADAQMILAGVEIALRDGAPPPPVEVAPQPVEAKKQVGDKDGDGIPDDVDKCPNEPEDKDGFEDDDGCPDPDNDKDGIPDDVDKCPNEPETVNGFQDEDGCPDSAPIVVKENRILLTEHLLFDSNRARIRPDSRPALIAVFELWKQHPEWDHLVVDGYADRHGPDGYNYWLSHVRAERVIKYLVGLGFPAEKLRIRAFGHRQVRVPGDTDDADRENRRVEFVIVKKGEVGPAEEAPNTPAPPAPANAPDETEPSTAPAPSLQPPPEKAGGLEP